MIWPATVLLGIAMIFCACVVIISDEIEEWGIAGFVGVLCGLALGALFR